MKFLVCSFLRWRRRNTSQRLAIHFFGHLRTFKETYNSFFEKVFIPNQEDGFLIDIFMHTWDEYDAVVPTYHMENLSIRGVKVSKEDIEFAKQVYHPKKFLIETMNVEHGKNLSLAAVNKLREEYAEEKKIKYDFFFYCRPDVLFVTPLRLKEYLDLYRTHPELSHVHLPKEYLFLASSALNRLPVMDMRYLGEADIVWFGSVPRCPGAEIPHIAINYILFRDFTLKRSTSKKSNPCSSERSNPNSSRESSPPPSDKKKKCTLLRRIIAACIPSKKLRSCWRWMYD